MTFRTTVSLTDHMRRRIEAFAKPYGATIPAALVALAARALDADERTRDLSETCLGGGGLGVVCEHGSYDPHTVTEWCPGAPIVSTGNAARCEHGRAVGHRITE